MSVRNFSSSRTRLRNPPGIGCAGDAGSRRAAGARSIPYLDRAVALVAVLMLTMGAAFALEGLKVRMPWVEPRTGDPAAPQTTPARTFCAATGIADRPLRGPSTTQGGSCPRAGSALPGDPNAHTSTHAVAPHARTCPTDGDSGDGPQHPDKANRASKDDQPGPGDHPGKDDRSPTGDRTAWAPAVRPTAAAELGRANRATLTLAIRRLPATPDIVPIEREAASKPPVKPHSPC